VYFAFLTNVSHLAWRTARAGCWSPQAFWTTADTSRGLPHNRRGWFGEKFDSRHTSRSTFLPYAATVISPVSKTHERRGEALVECCRPRAPADYSSWRCTDRGRSFWFRQPPRHPIPGQCTSLEPKFYIVLGGSVGKHACTFASRQAFLSGRRYDGWTQTRGGIVIGDWRCQTRETHAQL